MPSKKLTQILLSKSPFSSDEILKISEKEGWSWVYANSEPKKQRPKGAQICFTGFTAHEKVTFTLLAEEAGLFVVSSVTKNLGYLCIGDHPGESKVIKARSQMVQFLSGQDFQRLIETGELPARPLNN